MNSDYFSMDYSALDAQVKELFPEGNLPSFSELIRQFSTGEIAFSELVSGFFRAGSQELFYGFYGVRELLLIALAAAVFHLLSGVGKQGQAAKTGFFVAYLLMTAGVFRIFSDSREIVSEALTMLIDFMKVFLPVCFTGISLSSGGLCAAMFYRVSMLGIFVVSVIMRNIILPAIGLYFLLSVLNRVLEEDFLSGLAGLFYSAAEHLLKLSVGAVLGIGAIQGMLAPAADAVKRSAIIKTAGSIPVVGDLLSGTTQTVLAAGILLKNAIGVGGAVVIFFLCLFPLFRVGIANLSLRCGAAILQPVSDKRMVDCLGIAAKTHGLLIKLLLYTMLLFMLTLLFLLFMTGNRGGM